SPSNKPMLMARRTPLTSTLARSGRSSQSSTTSPGIPRHICLHPLQPAVAGDVLPREEQDAGHHEHQQQGDDQQDGHGGHATRRRRPTTSLTSPETMPVPVWSACLMIPTAISRPVAMAAANSSDPWISCQDEMSRAIPSLPCCTPTT